MVISNFYFDQFRVYSFFFPFHFDFWKVCKNRYIWIFFNLILYWIQRIFYYLLLFIKFASNLLVHVLLFIICRSGVISIKIYFYWIRFHFFRLLLFSKLLLYLILAIAYKIVSFYFLKSTKNWSENAAQIKTNQWEKKEKQQHRT